MALRLWEATTILREDSQAEFRASVTNVSTFIATGAGTGLSPRAPGTVGSLFGLVCFWLLPESPLVYLWVTWGIVTLLGIGSAQRAGGTWGVTDHPAIVIDEVIGMWLALLLPLTLLPFDVSLWPLSLFAFIAFRAYDILKPWPVNVLERRVPGGLGVVLDDVMAGAMAGVVVTLILIVSAT